MMNLKNQLKEIESYIKHQDKINTAVSSVAVGWQIEHMLLVINSVTNYLQQPNEKKYQPKNSFIKFFAFTFKKFPRNKAKAPKRVIPKIFDKKSIQLSLEKAHNNLVVLSSLNENLFFSHPIFGDLKLKKTIKFLGIHTEHHLKIIRDILK